MLPQGFDRLGGGRVSFSCLSKRKKPKRRTPQRPARKMKPSGFVSRCRGFPMAHPVPPGNARASMPAPLRADPSPPHRATMGAPQIKSVKRAVKSHVGAALAAMNTAQAAGVAVSSRRLKAAPQSHRRSAFALDPPGPHVSRRVAQTVVGERRDCSSTGMCEFAPADGCRATQGTAPAKQATRDAGVSFLWVTFLWTSTAPQERRERRSRPRRGAEQDARSKEN